jgi:putative phage-type endonuclease
VLDAFQRAQRRSLIGSSDASAVVGRDPWRSPYDLWAEKTGRLHERRDKPQFTVGTYLEDAILRWLEDKLGHCFMRNVFRRHPNGVAGANFDALDTLGAVPAIVEAKHAGVMGMPTRYSIEDFGEPGSDEVPVHVLIQVQHQLMVADAQPDLPRFDWIIVPALIIHRGFVAYRVPRSQVLMDALRVHEERFMRDYVEADVPPPEAVPSFETLKALKREPNKVVPVDPGLVERFLVAQEIRRRANKAHEAAQAEALAALGDAEAGESPIGGFTYLETTRAPYLVEENAYRTLRYKKPPRSRRGRG